MAQYDVTTANSSLNFDTQSVSAGGSGNNCNKIDDNHFINFWAGSGSDGMVNVFTVNT
jgi:hypothetical protein